ncbi:MAG TPA: DUF1127 domain-containing protein [Geminicoccus sp.]|nr:DUF1127 domain-containing protein [Geminicoccus sp.]
MATSCITLATAAREPRPSLSSRILAMVDHWIERHRERKALLELSDDMLKDIGVSRVDAMREGTKPFWTP